MKKTYLAPTVQVVRIEQSQMLCVSVQSDAALNMKDLLQTVSTQTTSVKLKRT